MKKKKKGITKAEHEGDWNQAQIYKVKEAFLKAQNRIRKLCASKKTNLGYNYFIDIFSADLIYSCP